MTDSAASATPPLHQVRPSLPGLRWPAVPTPPDAIVLTLQGMLAEIEFMPGAALLAGQMRQLQALGMHALQTTSHYREYLASHKAAFKSGLTPERWRELPVVDRETLQRNIDDFVSTKVPASHGPTMETSTSGTTGAPIKTQTTVLSVSWFKAANLHNYLLQGLDLTASVAAIRPYAQGTATAPDGATDPKWATGLASGQGYRLNIREPIAEQVDWLRRRRPRYLQSMASNLDAIARFASDEKLDLSFIEQVHSYGERLRPETRALVESVVNGRVFDTYSSVELGLLAWQCPGEDYQVASAGTHYIEILRDDGEPCAPGESGRVVITPLHNFATPLIRYANGDIAEVGEPCRHGRALPVIRRIMGRERNMLLLPDGSRRWMSVEPKHIGKHMPIVRAQLLQTALDQIEVRVQLRGELPEGAEARCTEAILADMPGPYTVSYRYEDRIELDPGGKFEDFICQVAR